jgi:ribonuclease HII
MTLLCPEALERLDNYPWHQNAGSFPLSADRTDVAIASTVLKNDLSSNNIKLLQLQSCCLDVAYYNKMVSAVKNKADVLFTATSQLIKRAYDKFGCDGLQIIVDRQGGRVHYRQSLQRMFPDMELEVIRESPTISSYQLQSGRRQMRLHFAVGADDRFLPVSLASMLSKYIRELLVDNINRYFTGFASDLQPTAGYWKDGLRFIEDLKRNIPHVAFDSNQLIRCR